MHESTKTLTLPTPQQGGDYKGIVGDLIQNHARDGGVLKAFSRFSCPEGVGICEQTAMSKNFLDKTSEQHVCELLQLLNDLFCPTRFV